MPIFRLSTGKLVYIDPETGKASEVVITNNTQLLQKEIEELNVKMLETSTVKDK